MKEEDKKRLEEIREEELKLHFEKERILHKEEWEQRKILYQKIKAMKNFKKVNMKDIEYLLNVQSSVCLSYNTKDLSYACKNVSMSMSKGKDRLHFDYVENNSDFDEWLEDKSSFTYIYIVDEDIPFEFINKENSYCYKSFVNLTLKENNMEHEYITVTIFLDEEKMKEI